MRLLDLRSRVAAPVTNYDSSGVSSVHGASGSGEGHVYSLFFEAGGQIGRHPAGPAQLFVIVEGAGWVEGEDGVRRSVRAGEAACFAPGEMHAKGSESGMTAVMIQLDRLEPLAPILGDRGQARSMADPVEVVPYRREWALRFEELEAGLREAAGDLVLRIEHVGSTAVPGLPAKPIIDVDLVIAATTPFDAVRDALAPLGYVHLGDLGITGREAFGGEGERFADHHLYVCREDSGELRRHLAFRDHLRGSPSDAADYGELKLDLARRFRNDRVGYTEAKTAFITRILEGSRDD
jgi:GrpB-like predicted nucleotidyltransferase (UPF0157 family)/quercetin dioxygenase-like cupin family protein